MSITRTLLRDNPALPGQVYVEENGAQFALRGPQIVGQFEDTHAREPDRPTTNPVPGAAAIDYADASSTDASFVWIQSDADALAALLAMPLGSRVPLNADAPRVPNVQPAIPTPAPVIPPGVTAGAVASTPAVAIPVAPHPTAAPVAKANWLHSLLSALEGAVHFAEQPEVVSMLPAKYQGYVEVIGAVDSVAEGLAGSSPATA